MQNTRLFEAGQLIVETEFPIDFDAICVGCGERATTWRYQDISQQTSRLREYAELLAGPAIAMASAANRLAISSVRLAWCERCSTMGRTLPIVEYHNQRYYYELPLGYFSDPRGVQTNASAQTRSGRQACLITIIVLGGLITYFYFSM